VLNQLPFSKVEFSDSLVRELKDIFARCDRNSSGLLAASEFKSALSSYGISCPDKVADSLIKKFDQNNKGSINFTEFCNCYLAVLNAKGLDSGGFFFK
jgi:Ca2+-binding EF-hand superfamily protein